LLGSLKSARDGHGCSYIDGPRTVTSLKAGRLAVLIVGVIILLMGVVFTLQGANVIGGSALMSGNSEYIYIGGVVAIIGLVVLALSFRIGRSSTPAQANPSPAVAS
jgi:hypothetical protein